MRNRQSNLFGDHEQPDAALERERLALRKQVESPALPHEPDADGWITMRKPCECGCKVGRLKQVNTQLTVRCEVCDRFQYNAPKAELGLPNAAPEAIRITSRYRGVCKVCGDEHDIGHYVWWIPKSKDGVTCAKCHGSKK